MAAVTAPGVSTVFRQPSETPIHGYFYSMVELGILRTFVEYRVFHSIPDTAEGITLPELARATGVNEVLLSRFSNYLIAVEVLRAPAPNRVAHTPLSTAFQSQLAMLFYPHLFDSFLATAVKWPEYFRAHGPAEPQASTQSPFGFAAGQPGKTFYEVLDGMPGRASSFNAAMAMSLGDMPITGVYDFAWVGAFNDPAGDGPGARTRIIDVGGGKGQALKAILEENPSIPPKTCVLQDQADVIAEATAEATGVFTDVKKMPHSFFDVQPVKGALIYYIRRVLNDWPDDEVVQILSAIRASCAPDSRVLVSENLLPERPPVNLAAADIWMMNFAGKRRTEKDFAAIAARAGLRVSSVARDEASATGVVEMMPV